MKRTSRKDIERIAGLLQESQRLRDANILGHRAKPKRRVSSSGRIAGLSSLQQLRPNLGGQFNRNRD